MTGLTQPALCSPPTYTCMSCILSDCNLAYSNNIYKNSIAFSFFSRVLNPPVPRANIDTSESPAFSRTMMTSTMAPATATATSTNAKATTNLKATSPTALDTAITFCSNASFHQSIYLPASSSHPKFRVTFSTSTNFRDESLPVVLFCHPMGAARYLIYGFDEMAKREGVRVVIVDR